MHANAADVHGLNVAEVKQYFLSLQADLCQQLSEEDGAADFQSDHWLRPEGGGGCTRILSEGAVFERAGVNFSHIFGAQLPNTGTDRFKNVAGGPFEAMGVSSVLHPLNPFVPSAHLNVRFFKMQPPEGQALWWFGGGFDLSPYYPFLEDCMHWHQTAYAACMPFGGSLYARFKQWADDYFYLKHRDEARGIGGLFFDDLHQDSDRLGSFEDCFSFVRSVGDHFIKAYRPIVRQRKNITYTAAQRDFQHYRRGRYVEFNLLYDRGTLFGLQSGGRVESILMSLPPQVQWRYNWQVEAGSPEAALHDVLKPRDWLAAT